MTNYTWNISVGGTVAAGGSATDNFVTVMWTATGEETVSVNYSNEQGCSAWQQTSRAVTVLSVPVILEVQNVTVTGGQIRCYDAIQTITVAGNGTTFLEHGGGSATFIAGQNILYLPGTRVETGGYMHGIIAPNGPFCGMLAPSIANTEVLMTNDKLPMTNEEGNGWFKVYPNPTDGKFTVEYTGKTQPGRITVEIYGMNGDKILSEAFHEERFHEFTLNGRPIGIYLIRMVTDGTTSTVRILKR